jgi:hypothetical protein
MEFGLVYGLVLTAVNALGLVAFLVLVDRDRVIGAPARTSTGMPGALPYGVSASRIRPRDVTKAGEV